jgi:hypothetical protein
MQWSGYNIMQALFTIFKGLDGGINLKVSYDGTNYTQLDIQNLPNVQIGKALSRQHASM